VGDGSPCKTNTECKETLVREENEDYSRWFTLTFNRTWVILDIHVDGSLDHTAALVRSSVGDSSRFVGCLYNTAMELWPLWEMQLDEAMSSGAPLALPNKAISIIWI
jgi:hypothetical protein